ncbi:MAG: HD domain-containing protein [Rhizobiaceae bacterium]|nr:HD domain-containing protein [Rhizobiaceae bacterium]
MTSTQMIAGIRVADTPCVTQALEYARAHSDAYLFNHSVRSWLFAVRIGQLRAIEHDGEVVAIGCLLHDIGLTKEAAGPRRFEIEGADVARSFVRDRGFDERRAQLIWDSVALNSTPSIGLFKEAEVSLCTAGIGLDFGGRQYDAIPQDEMAAILEAYPRLKMKKRITDCFCCIIESKPATTYDNFARDFGERFVAGYKPTSVVDYLMNSPFTE